MKFLHVQKKQQINGRSERRYGFTLIELLIVISIISTLATVTFPVFRNAKQKTYHVRTLQEFRAFNEALTLYLIDNNDELPADVNRDVPPGLEDYLSSDDWPDAPYPGSVYDWDNIPSASPPYAQISVRFCDISGNNCNFPDADWADDFDKSSSMYFCFYGGCRAHPSKPVDHPGYCVNC